MAGNPFVVNTGRVPGTGAAALPVDLAAAQRAAAQRAAAALLFVPQNNALAPTYASTQDAPPANEPPPKRPARPGNPPFNPPPDNSDLTIPDAFFETFIQKPIDLGLWVRDLGRGVIDVPAPGKPGSIAAEEVLKKVLGDIAVRPFKVINNSLGNQLDPSGGSEIARRVQADYRLTKLGQLHQFQTDALAKLVLLSLQPQNQTPVNTVLRIAALQELQRRGLLAGSIDVARLNLTNSAIQWLRGLVLVAQGRPLFPFGDQPAIPAGSADP